MKSRFLKYCFIVTPCLFFAAYFTPQVCAVETISIDGRSEVHNSAKPASSGSSSSTASGAKDSTCEKLGEVRADVKEILKQLADMQKELYVVKVRASRC